MSFIWVNKEYEENGMVGIGILFAEFTKFCILALILGGFIFVFYKYPLTKFLKDVYNYELTPYTFKNSLLLAAMITVIIFACIFCYDYIMNV